MTELKQETLGIIGGTGIYELEELVNVEERRVDTPFGLPSDAFIIGELGDTRLVFLSRHGRGHRILPHEINYRANIWAMKLLGVDRVLSLSAVGSMRKDIAPGDMVVVDQFFDRTRSRCQTFFGGGVAGHVTFADPVCPELSQLAKEAAKESGAKVHDGGTYICIEGPQFSTRAESRIFRTWGVDVIGMTNLPEARLAREAELCYSTVALVTDYDCWHEEEEDVQVDSVLKVLAQNSSRAKTLITCLTAKVAKTKRTCTCGQALASAILTRRDSISLETLKRMELLIGKYMK